MLELIFVSLCSSIFTAILTSYVIHRAIASINVFDMVMQRARQAANQSSDNETDDDDDNDQLRNLIRSNPQSSASEHETTDNDASATDSD